MMECGTLIFIPYQDTDNFYSDGILTREYAMLYFLYDMGFTNIINVKKPRTLLDSPKYIVHEEYYPEGTIENYVKKYCDAATTIQYHPIFSLDQIINRRCWWIRGYTHHEKELRSFIVQGKTIVYSDNPFAADILASLHEQGAVIYFDIMDNFAIHPSLNKKEHEEAWKGYQRIMEFADIVSANSDQTCAFVKEKTGREIILVKNGVFRNNETTLSDLSCVDEIKEKKKYFHKCAGYIGKLGSRLDADLIAEVSSACPEILFVFVGSCLKGQINEKLMSLFDKNNNVVHIDAIPSAYVYPVLNQFDILTIPHAVGVAENGGDPLKLYQYLTREKPIITTNILGVSEFEETIKISNESEEWIKYLKKEDYEITDREIRFTWNERVKPIRMEIERCSKFLL